MNNRVWNVQNPYQGKALRVLCVCSAGLLRSPTAANVLHRELGYNTRACGSSTDHALVPLDNVLCEWANEIVCMNQENAKEIDDKYADKVVILDIPDDYSYMDEDLQKLILEKYLAYGGNS